MAGSNRIACRIAFGAGNPDKTEQLHNCCTEGFWRGVVHPGMQGADEHMLNFSDKRIYLACGSTDMRKSINGLAAIVEGGFKLDPFGAALFVFCNRDHNRLKILEWDGDGFWLYFKRLEKGHFKWPKVGDETTMTLDCEEFYHLLGSPRLVQKIRRQEVKTGAII